ncbi:hypothetical protein Zm00014a_041858 [Zea mays]|uniref:Uncharacterized protein n=1 Tax=Zea mays TaxID=4577 RepID=A0A3L6DGV6_MAIZE|nr:hypothetical protein Zm00014a_041858 [Zea mays]
MPFGCNSLPFHARYLSIVF